MNLYGMMYYWDPTYILVIGALLLGIIAQVKVQSAFSKYSKIATRSGLSGSEVAARILAAAGLYDVRIEGVEGSYTDHYDPRTKTLRLSKEVFHSRSVTAVGVAAHECGHAIQHAKKYAPLVLRSAAVPLANIGSSLGIGLAIIGIIFAWKPITIIGILFFSAVVVFQIITLPVEFNASTRAIKQLDTMGILDTEELGMAQNVLNAAAMTYVAAAVGSMLQLLRLILLSRGRND